MLQISGLQIKYGFYCLLNALKKLYFIFLSIKLNKNKLEIDKQDIEINKLMEYKYKNNIWIVNIIKAI